MRRIRQRTALVLGAVLVAVLGLAGPAAAESSPGFGTITGHITTASGGPGDNTLIILVDAASGIGQGESVTDFDGFYEIDNVSAGTYKLYYNTNGQIQWAHQKLTFSDADTVSVAADQTTVVDEILLGAGAIAVSATDATTGQPVGHLCALAEGPTSAPEVCITDPGVLTVPDLGTGDYRLTVRSSDGLHAGQVLDAVHVEMGLTTPVPLRLTPTGAVAVAVTNAATGAPVRNACVTALRPGFNGPGPDYCPLLTGDDGRVTVGQLSAGTYNLFVLPGNSDLGMQWVGWHGGTGDQSAAVPVQVTAGQVSAAPTVRLDAAGSITGTIVDANGQPIRFGNATASVLPTGLPTSFVGRANTDDQGRYTIQGLGPYRWPVQYLGPWYGTQAWQWSGGTANRYESHRVTVAAGQVTTANFRTVPGGSLTGRVLNADGSLFDGYVEIRVYNAVTGDLAAPPTDTSQGTFTVNGLTTQDVKVQFTAASFQDVFIVGPSFDATAPIQVRLGATTTHDIVLSTRG
jgi:hypothetical protein